MGVAVAAAAAPADPCRRRCGGGGGGGGCRRPPDPDFEAVSDLGAAGDRATSPPPLPPSPPPAGKVGGAADGGVALGGGIGGEGVARGVTSGTLARYRAALDALPVPVVRPTAGLTGAPAAFLRSRLLPRLDAIEDEGEEGVAGLGAAVGAAGAAPSVDGSDSEEEEGAYYGVDLGAVASRLWEFHAALPRVRPHFAVKCNPDPVVVSLLAALGASFDCASEPEIAMVAAALGGDPRSVRERVVYANPCKAASHVAYARSVGVALTTFDNADELVKMAAVAPDARLLLRIATDDAAALCPLSSKFGAPLPVVPSLLRLAARLGLPVVGVAFHVGSGCTSLASYTSALHASRAVFDTAVALGLPPLQVLDIGGGFPGYDGDSSITFDQIVGVVAPLIDQLFPPHVDVIAEPGRFLVTSAYSLATQVLSRRLHRPAELLAEGAGFVRVGAVRAAPAVATDAPTVQYHLGDGVYGSFKDAVILDVHFPPRLLAGAGAGLGAACTPVGGGSPLRQPLPYLGMDGGDCSRGGGDRCGGAGGVGCHEVLSSTLCGPTNDPLDVMARGVPLPLLAVGDWLYFENMGAYTTSLCTGLDDTARPPLYYYSSV